VVNCLCHLRSTHHYIHFKTEGRFIPIHGHRRLQEWWWILGPQSVDKANTGPQVPQSRIALPSDPATEYFLDLDTKDIQRLEWSQTEAVSRWLPTAETHVQPQVTDQVVLDLWWTKWYWGHVFSKYFDFICTIFIPQNDPYSSIIRGGYQTGPVPLANQKWDAYQIMYDLFQYLCCPMSLKLIFSFQFSHWNLHITSMNATCPL
jgi:hypothetical protein